MGFKSAVTKQAFCALRCRSMSRYEHRSIIPLQYRPMVELDGHLGCLLHISPKCSKIITYPQITPDLINIINRLYNIIISSKNTYKPWVKVGPIHGQSMVAPVRDMETLRQRWSFRITQLIPRSATLIGRPRANQSIIHPGYDVLLCSVLTPRRVFRARAVQTGLMPFGASAKFRSR